MSPADLIINAAIAKLQFQRNSPKPTIHNHQGLKRWYAALADTLNANKSIWCVGASGTFGLGADNTAVTTDVLADANGYPGQLRTLLSKYLGTTAAGFIHPVDARAVKAGGGAAAAPSAGLAGTAVTITSAGSITYTLPSCTNFEILYQENDGTDGSVNTGGFSYTVDGGAANNVVDGGGVEQNRVRAHTGLTQGAHTVVITGLSASEPSAQCGIRYHSNNGVSVGRFGRSGWTIADILGTATSGGSNVQTALGQTRLLKGFSLGSPSLVIMPMGNNDAVAQATAGLMTVPSLFKSETQRMITHVQDNGGCILLVGSPKPSFSSGGVYTFDDYTNAYRELAYANTHVAMVDAAETWGTYAQASALGMYVDTQHPNRTGYGDLARQMFDVLVHRRPVA